MIVKIDIGSPRAGRIVYEPVWAFIGGVDAVECVGVGLLAECHDAHLGAAVPADIEVVAYGATEPDLLGAWHLLSRQGVSGEMVPFMVLWLHVGACYLLNERGGTIDRLDGGMAYGALPEQEAAAAADAGAGVEVPAETVSRIRHILGLDPDDPALYAPTIEDADVEMSGTAHPSIPQALTWMAPLPGCAGPGLGNVVRYQTAIVGMGVNTAGQRMGFR